MSTALTVSKAGRREKVEALVTQWAPQIEAVAYRGFGADRMATALLTLATKTPELLDCTPASLYLGLIKAARLGLDLGEGIHLVPLTQKGKPVAEAWVDYRGLKALAIRERVVTAMQEEVVYEGDFFQMELGLFPKLIHRPCSPDKRGRLIGAYTVIDRPRADRTFHYMAIEDIEAIRAKSRSWGPKYHPTCPTWYAKKTVARDYLRKQPLQGSLLKEAIATDDTETTVEVAEVPPMFPAAQTTVSALPERTLPNGAAVPGASEDAGIPTGDYVEADDDDA